jgi:hypothetical protein
MATSVLEVAEWVGDESGQTPDRVGEFVQGGEPVELHVGRNMLKSCSSVKVSITCGQLAASRSQP